MEKVIIELLPFLIPALFGIIGWVWRMNHSTQIRVAVMEEAIKDMLKTIESIQKRQDSHSQKQDEVLNKMNSMEHELIKQMGAMKADISSLASDVKNLNNLLAITDVGIKLKRE